MNRWVSGGAAAVLMLYGCGRGTVDHGASATTATDNGGTPVTMIGCLVPGTASAQGTAAGASDAASSSPGFSLIDVTTTSTASDAGAPTGVSGTAGTSAAPQVDTGQARSFELVGDKPADLRQYQNSSVEVTGLLMSATSVQRVHVQKVRQLEKSCR